MMVNALILYHFPSEANIGPLEDGKGDVITGNEEMAEALNRSGRQN